MSDELKKDGMEIPIEDGKEAEEDLNEAAEGTDVEGEAIGDSEGFSHEERADADGREAEGTSDEGVDAGGVSAEGAETEGDSNSGNSEGDDMNAKYVRLMAEFQNYKKRTAKEKEDIYAYGSEKVMTAITDVLDNFERALEQGSADHKYAEGMNLIFTQLMDALKKCGLEEIDALGQDFDPNFHSAVIMEDTDKYESGKVSFVVQKGYKLNGKVIRPAMVKVAN